MRTALRAALCAAALLLAAPAGALAQESPAVTQALEEIARYEGLAAAMAPGDRTRGRQYISALSAVGTRLRTAPRTDPRLPAAVERFNAVQQRITETANAAAAPAAGTPAPPAAAPAAPRLTSSDQARLNRVGRTIESLGQRIAAADLQTLLDERQVANFRTAAANHRQELAALPAEAAGVAEASQALDRVEAALAARLDDARARGAALGDVDAQLSAIDAQLQAETMPKVADFDPAAGPEAAARLIRTLAAIWERSKADLAVLDRLAAAGIKDQRIDRLRHWAGTTRQRQVEETVRGIVQAAEGEVARGLEVAAFQAATDPADAHQRANRLTGRGKQAATLAELDRGLQAVATAAAIDAALGRQGGPDRAQERQTLTAARAAYEAKVRQGLSLVRLPPAGLTEEKYLTIARETLADPRYAVPPPLRLVISSRQVSRHEKAEAEIRPGTVTTTATIYTWVWDEFQVTTAEPADGAVYLYHTTLKFFHQGAPTTPTGRWILADRFQGEQILAENVER